MDLKEIIREGVDRSSLAQNGDQRQTVANMVVRHWVP
jgi:hypothetical protein